MKVHTQIDVANGRYQGQVSIVEVSHAEAEQIRTLGDPIVETGGSFSGSLTRPGTTNTTILITGNGNGATAVPTLENGSIVDVTVTDPGSDYTQAIVTAVGDGNGVVLAPKFGVVSIAVNTPSTDEFEVGDILNLVGDPSVVLRVTAVDVDGNATAAVAQSAGERSTVPVNPVVAWTRNGIEVDFSVDLTWGISAVDVLAEGSGYNVAPIAVSFTLPAAPRRMQSDSPYKQVFDLADIPNADIHCRVWVTTIEARCFAAKQDLMARRTSFVGENLTTG